MGELTDMNVMHINNFSLCLHLHVLENFLFSWISTGLQTRTPKIQKILLKLKSKCYFFSRLLGHSNMWQYWLKKNWHLATIKIDVKMFNCLFAVLHQMAFIYFKSLLLFWHINYLLSPILASKQFRMPWKYITSGKITYFMCYVLVVFLLHEDPRFFFSTSWANIMDFKKSTN